MENKKSKKCCSNLQSARLSSQTKFALILVSLLFLILIVFLMILNIYLINSFSYKEINKILDVDEFNELSFAENNIENIQLQFENAFKNTLLSIVNLYKQLSNKTITNDFYKEKNYDFNLTFWDGEKKNSDNDSYKNMIFTCNKLNDDSFPCINITEDNSYNFYSYLGIYLKTIFHNKKIFMNNNGNVNFMHLLIICDFDNKDGNNVSFYYPGYTEELKKINENIIKDYVINKIFQKIKIISMFKDIFPNNLDYYENLFLLPFYDDDVYNVNDNDVNSYNINNLTYEIFNEEFLNNTYTNIYELAFMIVPRIENNEFVDINYQNINENIGQIFLLIGIKESSKVIFDKLNNQNSGLFLLRTKYFFPYELVNKGSCNKILNLGNYESNNNIDIANLKYLDECFDKNIKLKKFKNYSTYDKLLEDFSIFRNNISNYYNSNIVKLYKNIENKYLQKKNTSYSKTITKVSTLNNVHFKIKKTYSPLNIIYQINYFYPIDNIKMDILIKDENYTQFISKESKSIVNDVIITAIIFLIICGLILEIIIFIILHFFIDELNKPLDIINNPYFITGQIKEEEFESNNKSLNKNNIISDKKIHIDEFKELIKSVSEALKSETEYKQKINKKEEDDMKLEMEYLNKEFEKNKVFNIMVDENKINNILEESNYSNEIIKHKTNIENVKNDSFVKKSHLFREFVKNDEFEEFENSGENSFAIDSNTIFKDENTLQNPNSLFYDLFKTEFDENYVKRIEELKFKKENDKKKKSKLRINYKIGNEENKKEKIMNNINSKNKKDIFDFNDIINKEEDKNIINLKDENDIKNENNEEDMIHNNFLNDEEKLMKLYTEGNNEKEEDVLSKNNNFHLNSQIKTIIEEESDNTK